MRVETIAEEVSEAVNELIPQTTNGKGEKDVTIALVNNKTIPPGETSVDVSQKEEDEPLQATVSVNMEDKPEGVLAETTEPVSNIVKPKEPETVTAQPSMTTASTPSKLDISFYNSTARTSFRLAVCLEGLRCEADDVRCKTLHDKCNEGVNVTGVPFAVRTKLSECQV